MHLFSCLSCLPSGHALGFGYLSVLGLIITLLLSPQLGQVSRPSLLTIGIRQFAQCGIAQRVILGFSLLESITPALWADIISTVLLLCSDNVSISLTKSYETFLKGFRSLFYVVFCQSIFSLLLKKFPQIFIFPSSGLEVKEQVLYACPEG